MAETVTKQRRHKLLDKMALLGVSLVIVAPVVAYWVMSREAPGVCQSADDLAELSDDEELIVSRGLQDADLAELDRLTNLKELQLHFSDVTDAGMPHIGRHTAMERLVLAAEQISDVGIVELKPLVNLNELLLLGCTLVTPKGLGFIKDIPGLKLLVLHRLAGLDDGLGPLLAACKGLQQLELQTLRGITDRTVAEISKLSGLRILAIELCPQVTEACVKDVAGLGNLESLSLIGVDSLSDATLIQLGALKNLKKLQLPERAKFSKAALEELKKALPGCEFNM